MADFGSRNSGFFGGTSSGGGGGGISGSGTTNFLPKWASASSLTNSQIFDNGTSVGVGTNSPTSGFLFDVNTSAIVRTYFQSGDFVKGANQTGKIVTDGLIQSSVGINLASVTSTDINKMGFYNSGNTIQIWAGNNQLATFGLASAGGTLFDFIASWVFVTGSTGNSKAIRINSNLSSNSSNSASLTQILIDPTYNQGIFGTGTLRGVYYNPTTSVLNNSPHIAWENTSGDVIFGNLSGASDDRVLIIETSGKIKRQVDSFQLVRSDGSQDIVSAISGGDYRFGNVPDSLTMIISTSTLTTTYNNTTHIFEGTNLEFDTSAVKFTNASLQDNTAPAGLGVTYLLVTMPDGIVYSILCSETNP